MYTEISAAIQSAKTLGELLRAAKSLANYNEVVAAVSEVSTKLMEATAVALRSQERESELLARIQALELELSSLHQSRQLAESYLLHKFETGALAYALKEEIDSVPSHYLCAQCTDKGSHSKLQPEGSYILVCHSCEAKIPFKFRPPISFAVSGSPGREW